MTPELVHDAAMFTSPYLRANLQPDDYTLVSNDVLILTQDCGCTTCMEGQGLVRPTSCLLRRLSSWFMLLS